MSLAKSSLLIFGLLVLSFDGIGQDYLLKEKVEVLRLSDSLYNDAFYKETDSVLLHYLSEITNQKEEKNHSLVIEILQLRARYLEDSNELIEASKVALQILEISEKSKDVMNSYKANLRLALIFEKIGDYPRCKTYLDEAKFFLIYPDLDSISINYYIRTSSYFRFVEELDSMVLYAEKAKILGLKYERQEIADVYMLLGSLKESKDSSILYYKKAVHVFVRSGKLESASTMYLNIATVYRENEEYNLALNYYDSAEYFFSKLKSELPTPYYYYLSKSKIYEAIGSADSALFYYKLYHEGRFIYLKKNEKAEVLRITTDDKSRRINMELMAERALGNMKSQGLTFISALLAFILLALFVLAVYYRKVNQQFKLIQEKSEELNKSLEEKEILFSEVHHRVKNNLQIVNSMLSLQLEDNNNSEIERITRESQSRVMTMAIVHETLYTSNDFEKVNAKEFVVQIANYLSEIYKNENILLKIDVEKINISLDTSIPIGLILNELISNAYKHAFKGLKEGVIEVDLKAEMEKDSYNSVLIVKDNGIGAVNMIKDKKSSSLGAEIIKGLVHQIDGQITILNNNGTEVIIKFNRF